MSWYHDIGHRAKKAPKKAAGAVKRGASGAKRRVEVATDRRVCIGITGLSQSGKSTFITSLINQLRRFDDARLTGFPPQVENRILSIRPAPLGSEKLPEFPYDASYRAITSTPAAWPASTTDVSGCLLELRMRQRERSLLPFTSDEFTLKIEIRDYPGEWLLDLPLMRLSYEDWCGQCLARYTSPPRDKLLGALLGELQQLDPFARADLDRLGRMNAQFKDFLTRCKDHGESLSLIQPGRFLIPGAAARDRSLGFIPLLRAKRYSDAELAKAAEDSYFKVNQQWYQRYKRKFVKPFFREFFSDIDRQLVLVDVISALYAGREYLEDLRDAIRLISDCFNYGQRGGLGKLLSPKIDKVVYAASKIDQVVSAEHDNVRHLLSSIVRDTTRDIAHSGVESRVEATAAVRSSSELNDRRGTSIQGYDIFGRAQRYINPDIPAKIPDSAEEWKRLTSFSAPRLRPPPGLSYQNEDVIPHIRMDSVLYCLIGDKC